MQEDTVDHDRALADTDRDEFGRRDFAVRLAGIVAAETTSEPLVVSLYGAWGEGKSTTLNFTTAALRKSGSPVMEFNPWRFPGEEALLAVFFHQIAKLLDRDLLRGREKLAPLVEQKFPWLNEGADILGSGLLSGGGKIAREMVAGVLSRMRPKIESLRERLAAELRRIKGRVVVVIDDADRLEGDDLVALLRLIKLTADFPNTTFLLAIDDTAVSRVLGERNGGGETAGRAYLEKIVQVPLRLPPIAPARMRTYTCGLLVHVLQSMKREPSESQAQRFLEIFEDLFAPRILTPRQAKLVANSIRFAVGLLPGELDIADQMLLECARVTWPELYAAIQRHSDLLIPGWEEADAAAPGKAGDRLEAFLKSLPRDPAIHPERLRQGLRGWFPRLGGVNEEDGWAREQRLCSEKYFWRYFALHIAPDDYPDGRLRELLRLVSSLPRDGENGAAPAPLVDHLARDLAQPYCESMLTKLELHAASLPGTEATRLAEALTAALERPADPDAGEVPEEMRELALRLAGLCLEREKAAAVV